MFDLILFCPAKQGMWLPDRHGRTNFFDQLSGGEVPAWLRALSVPTASGVRLYEVIDPANEDHLRSVNDPANEQ